MNLIDGGAIDQCGECGGGELLTAWRVGGNAALFADANVGGLALGVKELDCEWDVEDADALAVAIPARYQITYRSLAADLSTKG